MSRLVAVVSLLAPVLAAFAQSASAQVPAPRLLRASAPGEAVEKLLSPSTQLYFHWDGIAAHNAAYKNSFWGDVMAGPTGNSIRTLISEWPKYLGFPMVTAPLIEGKPPEELKKNLANYKNLSKLVDVFADRGIVVGTEIRPPVATLKGLGEAVGSLLRGNGPNPESLTPEVQVLLIVPNAAERWEVLHSTLQIVYSWREIEPFEIAGRKGFRHGPAEEANQPSEVVSWWLEGKHFVFCPAGSTRAVVNRVAENIKKGGVTGHPLFQKCSKNPGYETVARGFIDTGSLISLAKGLLGPSVPGLATRLDDLGLGNLKSIAFVSGFEGKESRATYDFELPGEWKGLAKVIKNKPLGVKDLPPLPPDVNRFSALSIDVAAVYETSIAGIETLFMNVPFGAEQEEQSVAGNIRLRREFLKKTIDGAMGVNIEKELLPHLGDKFVLYNSPSEGLMSLGTGLVICCSVKDAEKAKAALSRLQKSLESLSGIPVKSRRKTLCGVEIRELYSSMFFLVTPTFAIAGDWLVFSLQPQPVQGFILRLKGELPAWKPDAASAERIARLPANACGLQYCDPRVSIQNLGAIAPLGLSALNSALLSSNSNNSERELYQPIDVGLLPNPLELNKHLFPNLTATLDDGKTLRVEIRESLSLPLEFIGIDTVALGGGLLTYIGAIPRLFK